MNFKCFFGHKFQEESSRVTMKYENFNDKCKHCGFRKIEILDGNWGENSDDYGGDEPLPSEPQLSPDDYYEKICKE